LHGSQHILHAGDIGDPEILEKLRTIAPLTAIRGNIDQAPWCRKLALAKSEIVEVAGISLYLLHDLSQLDLQPEAAGCKVVIYGHSHVPQQETRNGVLYFNPGSAGPRRFKLPVTVGRLIVEAESVRGEIIPILD
jgi:putative phosphoesterase